MARQIILGKNIQNGQKELFLTLESASEMLGVSVSTVSRAVSGLEECNGWLLRRVDRVFAVRLRDSGAWRVVSENGRGSGYVEYGNPFVRIGKKEVDRERELTLYWYND